MIKEEKSVISTIKSYFLSFLKWLCLGVGTGILCGFVGALFAKSIKFVTELRQENLWLLLLLPIGGLASVAIYKIFKVGGVGTNQVFESVRNENDVSVLLAPAVFMCSVLTHLCGGSAGKEGAALQLGGSLTSFFGKLLRLDDNGKHILMISGMAGLFSAVFGTPIGAAVFALEVVSVGSLCSAAVFPSFVSSITAYFTAFYLNVKPERLTVHSEIALDVNTAWRVAVVAVVAALVSILFCYSLHLGEKLFKKAFKNEYLRIAVGGTMIIALTALLRTTDYNGGGIDVIERIFDGSRVSYAAFLFKIIFTAITVSAGFKGGEIVPTLFIGATLGNTMSALLGLDSAFGAAVGISALFCGVTNCPLASIFLSVELFGADGLPFYALSVAISFLLSGKISLYKGQRLIFSKLNDCPQ